MIKRSECTCSCHHDGSVHCVPCCYPDAVVERNENRKKFQREIGKLRSTVKQEFEEDFIELNKVALSLNELTKRFENIQMKIKKAFAVPEHLLKGKNK